MTMTVTNTQTSSSFEWRKDHQYYAAIAGNLLMLGNGCILGWISPAISRLSSPDTPLVTGPLTSHEVSWIAAINSIGAMCGSLTFGFIVAGFGCKRTMVFLALPLSIFWILIYFGNTYYHILWARFITGWAAGGVQCTAVLYISEISSNEIRGRLGSLAQVFKNSGILFAYTLGAVLSYEHIPCIFICIPLLFAFCFSFVPNTPQYHLQKEDLKKAENALKYYNSFKGETEHEINAFYKEFKRMKSIAQEQKTDEKLHFSDFTNSKALKGFLIGTAMSYFSQLSGSATIVLYAVYILERTGTKFDPYKSSIALGVVLILGNLCTTQMADTFGRKTFLIVSLMGCAVGHISLSAFLYFNQIGYNLSNLAFVPLVSLGLVVFIASAGIVPLSHVVRVENFPTKIRTMGVAVCIFGMYITLFTCTKLFPILIDKIGMHGCMIIFAVNCIIGSIFIFFVLDETRGKPMDTLQSENTQRESA